MASATPILPGATVTVVDARSIYAGYTGFVQRISGGNDLLEIELHSGKTVLVPFVEAIVPEVQLEEGWLRLTPPPGLL